MRWDEAKKYEKKNNNKTKTNIRTNHTTRKSKRESVDVVVYLVAVSSIKLAWDLSILVFVCVYQAVWVMRCFLNKCCFCLRTNCVCRRIGLMIAMCQCEAYIVRSHMRQSNHCALVFVYDRHSPRPNIGRTHVCISVCVWFDTSHKQNVKMLHEPKKNRAQTHSLKKKHPSHDTNN